MAHRLSVALSRQYSPTDLWSHYFIRNAPFTNDAANSLRDAATIALFRKAT